MGGHQWDARPQARGGIFGTHTCEHLQAALQAAVRAVPAGASTPHPLNEGVVLGHLGTVEHGWDAVLSLCRLGQSQLPAPGTAPGTI